MQGISALLPNPKPRVAIKGSDKEFMQYEAIGFVRGGANKTEIRNLMYDLAHRHLEASGIDFARSPVSQHLSPPRLLLERLRIFHSLSNEEKDNLSQHMVPCTYSAGQQVLDFGEVADGLLLIGSGVISAKVPNQSGTVEAGRLGPGDILGEEGVAGDGPSPAQFTALTPCVIYRIEKDIISGYLEEYVEVSADLSNLRHLRKQLRHSLMTPKPALSKKGSFLQWWLKK
jgi:CRP-like cAMP-binding protein